VRFLRTSSVCNATALLAAFLPLTAFAQHPEVLVVYNSADSDSLSVANHYMSQRNIPNPKNLCAITPPSTTYLSLSDYTTYVKTPIQNCLNTLGQKSILYIVMSYMTPFGIIAGPQGLAALDSYLADIWDKYASQPFLIIPNLTQPYYADSQSQGNVYTPFQSLAAYRANARNPLIYSVWRLDAPTPALASALVDQAIAVESTAPFRPSGQACIDLLLDPTTFPDYAYRSGDWDLYRASQFLSAAGLTVLTDTLPTEFGTPPSPNCPDTAFYTGWYSLEHYNDAFTWQTGSVGWHLDSGSAESPRSGQTWSPNALLRGIAVTTGSVDEPYLQGLVRPGGTYRNLLEGASVGDAFLRNTRWLKWEIMNMGDPLYKPFGTGLPPFSPLLPVNSFMLSPQEIVGGTNSTGTITLSAAAPAGGTSFTLTGGPGISIPPMVTVAGGTTKASFPVTTTVVTAQQAVVITATGPVTLQNTIVTDPLLGGFVPSINTTMAGYPVSVTAILNGRAPVGGATISLTSDNPAITVPPTVTVPAGSMVATFTAGSTPVSSAVTANITGTYAGAPVPFSITVAPGISSMGASPSTINAGGSTIIGMILGTIVPPGNTATVQMMSSDPVSLPVPATVMVPAGSSYGNFLTTSSAGSSGNMVVVTATYGGSTVTTTVTIN
jgi:uncharacterized protein (TIGR03790 family)